MVAEGAISGGDGCDGTDTLRAVSVSDTTLGSGGGWDATTADCGVNSCGNVGIWVGKVSGVSTTGDTGI